MHHWSSQFPIPLNPLFPFYLPPNRTANATNSPKTAQLFLKKSVKNTNFLTKVIKWRAKRKTHQQSQLHWSKRFQKPFFSRSSKRMHFFLRFTVPLSTVCSTIFTFLVINSISKTLPTNDPHFLGGKFFLLRFNVLPFFGFSLLAFPFGLAKVFPSKRRNVCTVCMCVCFLPNVAPTGFQHTNQPDDNFYLWDNSSCVEWQAVLGPRRCTYTQWQVHTKEG